MTADLLREKFLDFFKEKRHKLVESDSLVPADDPTVLFTPAGMNQFKKNFLGLDKGLKRAASSQRCLRTDDLDKVGKTISHHTFFEMLGNFSFGDYFKKEAIKWAWEFLTQELKIPVEKLWVSVYQDDMEAYAVWNDVVGIAEQKIVKLGDKDNFWPAEAKAKGPNGPCGPCSEIFYDFGAGCGRPECSPACDCGRFVEVWNLVFTQFERKEGGVLSALPQKNIDTGMGLERLAAVMQGKKNNFETDLFSPILEKIYAQAEKSAQMATVYAIADHLRAVIFSIYDGVLPSNDGRGYIVRKLIRRASLHLSSLGIDEPFLYKLVPVVAKIMQVPYPELTSRREDIAQVILAEERNFTSNLNVCANRLKERCAVLLEKPDAQAAGKIAFELYDTYGVPLELIRDYMDEYKIAFSQQAFDAELQAQKSRSRAKTSLKGDVFGEPGEKKISLPATKFAGYKRLTAAAKVLACVKVGAETKIILDKTPFYAESGGQAGDSGVITKGKKIFAVRDTKKSGNVVMHIGQFKYGELKKSDKVTARVDAEKRLDTARNHTATHLLQAALRKVLGAHVQQQGSLVCAEKLRFDFSHFQALSRQELSRVEEEVNNWIINSHKLSSRQMALTAAKKAGALAFFAEKYAGRVRVVSVGEFSRELCGGTHLDSTGQIGYFKITHEGSVASGIRRIEAVTGRGAFGLIREEGSRLEELSALLNVPQERLIEETEKRLRRLKEMEKAQGAKNIEAARQGIDEMMASREEIGKVKLVARVIEGAQAQGLRALADALKEKLGSAVVALGAGKEKQAVLVLGVTPDLCAKGIDAGKITRQLAALIGGSGGGRPDFAQAGGNKPEGFAQLFAELRGIINKGQSIPGIAE
jgi:alanyl-tRNA synthetase